MNPLFSVVNADPKLSARIEPTEAQKSPQAMNGLTKTPHRLLRMVKGKPHANDNDHVPDNQPSPGLTFLQPTKITRNSQPRNRTTESTVSKDKALLTPPASFRTNRNGSGGSRKENKKTDAGSPPVEQDDDDFRDPESSGDEYDERNSSNNTQNVEFRAVHIMDVEPQRNRAPSSFRLPQSSGSGSSGGFGRSKDVNSDASDEQIFGSSQGSFKRRRIDGPPEARLVTNIHAGPVTAAAGTRRRKGDKKTYGGSRRPEAKQDRKKKSKKGVGIPQKSSNSSKFKKLGGVDAWKEDDPEVSFKTANTSVDLQNSLVIGDEEDEGDDTSSLSSNWSFSGDDQDMILDAGEKAPPSHQRRKTKCPFCGEKVDPTLQEDFDDEFNVNRQKNIKWQRRFCNYHKQRQSESLWLQRGYPKIDWERLETRMERHYGFLASVLDHSEPSEYRTALKEKTKPGTKGIHQSYNNAANGKPGALVGYYGPRGEKAM